MNEYRKPRSSALKRLLVVILFSLLGFTVFAVAYPIVAGAAGGTAAGY